MSNFWSNLHKPLIAPLLLQGRKSDWRSLARLAGAADVLQIVLPDSGLLLEQPRALPDYAKLDLAALLKAVQQFRRKCATPLILQAAVNQALVYGLRSFFADFAQAGVNAFLLRDLPLEEAADFVYLAEQQQTLLFLQAADSASTERFSRIARAAPQGVFVLTTASGQEALETDRLLNTARRLQKKENVPVIIDHVLKQEDNLFKLYQAADGLVVRELSRLSPGAACCRLKIIRRALNRQTKKDKPWN